jgi:tetratricopeptide (TPR) repeat protein
LLEREREKFPDDHWVQTQLSVTFYEQQRYWEALDGLLASRRLVPDCPLTLWNLAGVSDALGNHTEALKIYRWILASTESPEDDPCWESKEWTDVLKTDCVYRIGVCLRNLGQNSDAENCFRQYLQLLSLGIEGTYSAEDALRQIQGVSAKGSPSADNEVQKSLDAAIKIAGGTTSKNGRRRPPEFDERDLAEKKRVSAKRSRPRSSTKLR